MNYEKTTGGEAVPGPRRPNAGLGSMLFRLTTQFFGGRMSAAPEPESIPAEPEPAAKGAQRSPHPVAAAAQVLERALAEVEAVLGRLEPRSKGRTKPEERGDMTPDELTELKRAIGDVTLRLSDEISRLASVADRLEARCTELERAVRERGLPVEPATLPASSVSEEPQFVPGDRAVDVLIASVPGFQGLMDAQRALSDLAGVEGASVSRYQNGDATLEIALHSPITPSEIVAGLELSTGHSVIIEEARPEASRLRLRFVEEAIHSPA